MHEFAGENWVASCIPGFCSSPNGEQLERFPYSALLLTCDHQARALITPQEIITTHGTDLDLAMFV
jgi:hypothetical protein